MLYLFSAFLDNTPKEILLPSLYIYSDLRMRIVSTAPLVSIHLTVLQYSRERETVNPNQAFS
ncbi:hypothetical protein J2S14_004022 [Lederbergia wuyishanensis]|uniref:Uncharacterized protein n=1 Tax=Lederbergia wuyishanensis TaxID=1347903 RepID=A0ABU0DA24_9BACI|nr:hypothetical protein [Lederbergia wuyishanensis]